LALGVETEKRREIEWLEAFCVDFLTHAGLLRDFQDSTLCACPPCTLIFLAVTRHSSTWYLAWHTCSKR